ncbi:glycosyltransferase [Vespertiliibacter pulmonis]|uniref:Glycosyltransferase involved in cell wall biosynthesis n=1 Tax=Vespertiliibacter pulmonis TaxID=1443036 RepID=A0A3N4W9T1_9PAST|nr:glycosyltransferase family 2 protein [Vespertiliibacter pulmonis]QLB20324.1 glycosyltransferase [Vespertiliibacter pulmonis]RPE86307.1 glycosyltransferase involved in cell wall biosynthesis [Vespertiliibacter pulmonis]
MFSIIVPSYNRKNEIPTLLKDLEKQTIYNFEVIIIDDHSIEPIEIHHTYPFKVTIIRNIQNKGAAESRNIGVANANYEWLLFLDDDDRFQPNKCELLAKTIDDFPEINFIYHPAKCIMVNENFTYLTHPYQNIDDITLDNILKSNKIGGMPMIAIKKSLFEDVGGLSTELLSLEDYDFILKVILNKKFKPKYIEFPLTQCTFHTNRSSVSTNIKNTENAIQYIFKNYVKTDQQQLNFEFNSLYILAYPYIMNLSRKAAKYYFFIFKKSLNIKYLVIAFITFISPKLAINLKRFI